MQNEGNPIQEYVAKRKSVMEHFKCEGDYYIKPLLEMQWKVSNEEDFYLLSYWSDNFPKTNSVILQKAGKPMIYEDRTHTMVVGIDCVKIAFLFENGKRLDSFKI